MNENSQSAGCCHQDFIGECKFCTLSTILVILWESSWFIILELSEKLESFAYISNLKTKCPKCSCH